MAYKQGRIQEFVQGGLNLSFQGRGAQHPLGPENPLKSIDFTGPGPAYKEPKMQETGLNRLWSLILCITQKLGDNERNITLSLLNDKVPLRIFILINWAARYDLTWIHWIFFQLLQKTKAKSGALVTIGKTWEFFELLPWTVY